MSQRSRADVNLRVLLSRFFYFTVLVYGSHVNLIAAGKGSVRLAGMPDTPQGDGTYSLNDGDFHSLPGVQTSRLTIGTSG